VLDLKFINDSRILLQFASNISIISFKMMESNCLEVSLNFTKISINKYGNLIATLVDPTTVKIFDLSMNETTNF
jgi:hypothetical protein